MICDHLAFDIERDMTDEKKSDKKTEKKVTRFHEGEDIHCGGFCTAPLLQWINVTTLFNTFFVQVDMN